jgi:hypothetical protein
LSPLRRAPEPGPRARLPERLKVRGSGHHEAQRHRQPGGGQLAKVGALPANKRDTSETDFGELWARDPQLTSSGDHNVDQYGAGQ